MTRGRWPLIVGMVAAFWMSAGSFAAEQPVEPLIIAASPSMKAPVEALGREFEKTHPYVRVKVYYDSGLGLRRTVSAFQNTGKYFVGSGPVHVIAPGGDELITRLEQKYYVLPGTRRSYAAEPLTLVVPVTLVDAPASFDDLGKGTEYRIAIADPALTELGRQTMKLFDAARIASGVKGRLDVASDARGVLDHLLYGQADVGIIFGPDAISEKERVRVVAMAKAQHVQPVVHSMAMERFCPNRVLCEEFLMFLHSAEAQKVIKALGYLPPSQ